MINLNTRVENVLHPFKESLNINTTIFDHNLDIVYTYSYDLGQKILLNTKVLEKLIKENSKFQYPIIIGSNLAIMWICVYDKENDLYFVLGPFTTSSLNQKTIDQYSESFNLSIDLKYRLWEYLEKLPISTYNSLFPYCITLHYLLNNEKIKTEQIEIYANKTDDEETQTKHNNDRMRTWKIEQELMKNIEEGNIDFKSSLDKARQVSYGLQIESDNTLTQMKYSVLTFITLSVRAAIRGGLTPELAYSLGDSYISKLEKCDSMASFSDIANEMFSDFIQRVHQNKNTNDYSNIIKSCIDYIDLRIEETINLSELAQYCGYSDYYLTKKFKKETGISIKQYITNKKIERAKLYLESSDMLIKDISDKLCFDSETYFSTVFLKHVGISPIEYRKNNNNIVS